MIIPLYRHRTRLYSLYIQQKKSIRDIATQLNCGATTIRYHLRKFSIPRRTKSETNKIRIYKKSTCRLISEKAKERLRIRENNPMAGRHHSEETKRKISNRYYPKGKEAYNYNKCLTVKDRVNRRLIFQHIHWSRRILKNASYTCQVCGDSKGGNLIAHHLESWHWCKNLRACLFNGVCLCENCHKKFHKVYGYKYNTTKQFILFIDREFNDK